MLFHSQIFLLAFLPVVLAAYYAAARHVAAREWLLVLASLVFYSWWDVRFLPLLLGQTLLSWLLGGLHYRTGARWPLFLAIAANLAVLGAFKYLDFFTGVVEGIVGLELPRTGLILPVGISFYTFQIVSYLIDALRGDAPQYGVRRFALFVVLFPQLVAGPIVRHNEIVDQFDRPPLRPGVSERIAKGLVLLLIGVTAKVLIADRLAGLADPVFMDAQSGAPLFTAAWMGTLAFALQIFFDFAAYSDMAIGLAMMFGLHLPQNFNQPYGATSLQDFWRRWHMTLSRFLRDYLYIPLGGSRMGPTRFVIATLVTMGLCGLWHGAGWTFIVWGLIHGLGLLVVRAWRSTLPPLPAPAGWILTFLFAVVAFAIFRAPDMSVAANILSGLAGGGSAAYAAASGPLIDSSALGLIAIATVIAVQPWPAQTLVERFLQPSRVVAGALAVAAIYLVLLVGEGQPLSFIYFQF